MSIRNCIRSKTQQIMAPWSLKAVNIASSAWVLFRRRVRPSIRSSLLLIIGRFDIDILQIRRIFSFDEAASLIQVHACDKGQDLRIYGNTFLLGNLATPLAVDYVAKRNDHTRI